jgi:hypothetical protein
MARRGRRARRLQNLCLRHPRRHIRSVSRRILPPPPKAHTRTPPRAEHAGILLKMGPRRCKSTFFLDHMNTTIDFLLNFSYYKTQSVRQQYRASLCNAISATHSVDDICAYFCIGPYSNSVTVRANISCSDTIGMLAAAAAVDSVPALRLLVSKVRDIALSSELYGSSTAHHLLPPP